MILRLPWIATDVLPRDCLRQELCMLLFRAEDALGNWETRTQRRDRNMQDVDL